MALAVPVLLLVRHDNAFGLVGWRKIEMAVLHLSENARSQIQNWFARFAAAFEHGQEHSIEHLLNSDCYWRDLLSFGWKIQTKTGATEVIRWFREVRSATPARNMRLRGEVSAGRLGDVFGATLETFFDFDTDIASGRGYVRLIADKDAPTGLRAVSVLTAMHELHDYRETTKRNRPRVPSMLPPEAGAVRPARNENPDAVVIGGGQSGLMVAARLKQIGVNVTIIEKAENVGDLWRRRYRGLKLHNETCMNHFPYLNFPESWPSYLPRDKVADWLEFYAASMELDIATSTTCEGGTFDSKRGLWNLRLKRRSGSTYELNPKHVVLAAGVSGLPNIPHILGRETFTGTALHSSQVTDDFDVHGKTVLVVGAGTSAHDIAQMSYMNGADVTLVQRSSITVVSLEPSGVMPFGTFRDNDGIMPIDDLDLIYASVPYDLLRRLQHGMSKKMMEADAPLLKKLRDVGFLLDNGFDDTGWVMKLFRAQAGYYLNVGASDLIAAGKIKLRAGVSVSQIDGDTVTFSDGQVCEPDVIVFATGYRPMEETLVRLFGPTVAEAVGPIYGISDDGEVRGMYGLTGQPHFYATGGGFAGSRSFSRYIALLIKAQLEGLLKLPEHAETTTVERMSEPA